MQSWSRAALFAIVCLAVQAVQADAPATAPSTRRATRVLPWRGAAAAPAGADTFSVQSILRARSAALDSALSDESALFDTLGIDSLTAALDRGGADAMRSFHAKDTSPSGLRFVLRPLALSTYERIDGLRLGSGVGARVGRHVAIDADAAYGFAAHNWSGSTRARVTGKRRMPALDGGWSDRVEPFGPNRGAYFTSFTALVAGQDRQDYLRRRAWDAGLRWRPVRRTDLAVHYFVHEDQSANAATDFRFAGNNALIERANPSIDRGTARGLLADAAWASRHGRVRGDLQTGVAGNSFGGDFDYAWQEASLTVVPAVVAGGTLRLTVAGANTAGTPPTQALPYLGGDGNLRGFEALEFSGRRRATVRAEYSLGRDLLARTRIPVVRALHLQFIPFADAGSTWGDAAGVGASHTLDGTWKSSLGLGIQRDLYYPGFGSLRLDVSRRTDGGPGGVGVWFRVLPFEDTD